MPGQHADGGADPDALGARGVVAEQDVGRWLAVMMKACSVTKSPS
ncbi:MAG: hypothetical protein OXG37_10675 [Actinomycetia bacterium]|nr:hypothetical protein [Actinomycetes bacterium]